jgi:hypothetical protein
MRLRSEVVGALNLFTAQAQDLDAETLQLRRALADAATNDLPQARTILQRDALTEQSQSVLDTRVLIQHAKGVIAERHHIDMDGAFTLARASARSHNRRLANLARPLVEGSETV